MLPKRSYEGLSETSVVRMYLLAKPFFSNDEITLLASASRVVQRSCTDDWLT